MAVSPPTTFSLEHVLHAEHARLVRLCAHLSGDRDAADDLAQETLIEAWRQRHKLNDPDGAGAWLNAIARNVCLRWARRRGRELARTTSLDWDMDEPFEDFDLDVELERDELATLLDRALALLPSETRAVLIEKYVEDSPHAQIAARLGLSENAVAVRVHRGKLAFKRILTTELRDEAAAYGLITPPNAWQETRIWCAMCGQRRLMGRFLRATGSFTLRCPQCVPNYHDDSSFNMAQMESADLFAGVKGFKPALSRLMTFVYTTLDRAVVDRGLPCVACSRPVALRLDPPMYQSVTASTRALPLSNRGVYMDCASCGTLVDLCLEGLVLFRPEGQQLWREEERIRLLPERERELGGRSVIITSFASVNSAAQISVAFDRETYNVLHVDTTR